MTNAQTQPSSSPSLNVPLPVTNSDLKSLHDSLVKTVSSLYGEIGDAPDEKTVDALTTEITEANHRVTIVGNLLFTQNSQEITKAVQAVSEATADVNKSIQQAQSAIAVINSVTSYLALVDKAINTAKLIAAA